MLYVLHHPKGALMLTAQTREQVQEWSQRQLGSGARLVSIWEHDGMESVESVERSGTGIQAASKDGCLPFVSIMPNLESMLTEVRGDHRERGPLLRGQVCHGRIQTWH